MDEDQLFELEYHDEMEVLEELENGTLYIRYCIIIWLVLWTVRITRVTG